MKELDDRLSGNQKHLTAFLQAREALKKDGVAALGRFEKVSGDYTGYILSNMGHHGPSTDLAQKLFSVDDWAYMAGITDEETRREQSLHQRVFASLPKGMKPPPAS